MPPLSRYLPTNSKRLFCFSTVCSTSSSVVCSPAWSPSSWDMAAIAFWLTSSAWTRTPSLADASNCSIRMYRRAAHAVPAADASRSKKTADIVTLIEFLLEYDTAGDPITGLKWSRRTTDKIALALADFGVTVSPNTVARLLHKMGYSLRVNHKKLSTGFSPYRNDQFLYLRDLRQRFQRRGLPIISVDTKKRELVGNFKNPGSRWDLSPCLVNDHDFRSDSTGVAIPYGIYDLLANRGSVMVGVSHDTSAFAAHAIAHWWRQEGAARYPRSRQLLILSDTGGSNGARRRTWKTELQSQVADSLGLTLTVAHYPTGASKWNPIEHRLFSEISKNWAGEPLDSYQKILNFIRSTRTETGLAVTAHLDRRNYPTGTEPTPEQLQSLRLKPHEVLPKWNYTISPNL